MPSKLLTFIVLLIVFNSALCCAQSYIGGSVNFGNFVVAEPSTKGIRRSTWPCGNVTFARVNRIYKGISINYSASVGFVAYNLRVMLSDTLSKNVKVSNPEFSTVYLRANLSVWQKVNLGSKPHFIGLGGGLTLHPALYVRTGFTFLATYNNENYNVLEASITNNISKPLLGFLRASLFKPVGKNLLFGFEYTHHTAPILTGHYRFSHTRTPSFGELAVYQREISFTTLVRISRKELIK